MDAIEEITVLKGKKARILSEESLLGDECLRQMEEFQDIKLSNERKINDLGQLYSKPVHQNNSISEFDLFAASILHIIFVFLYLT